EQRRGRGNAAPDSVPCGSKQPVGERIALPRRIGDVQGGGSYSEAGRLAFRDGLIQATGQAGARRDALDTAVRSTATDWPVGPDDDVADVAGVACESVEQAPVEDDASAYAGGDDHAQHARGAVAGASPAFAERQSLGIVVDDARPPEGVNETLQQRKISPGGDVDR